ncbi:ParB/RepB/Spo0J family partition protein [Nocardioides marmotae]|uniref:ParB/RepB/Spo0J family partition protein n=1 Tax=Nocardioides marmotae TaxID=2663857 RepID=UPI0012B5261E|nr:ParB/RepB/Spo0J family partition protein [Nocardioides marmotae]MBC9732386.1 ParB/RepB/Spo0J family partition protein [Nocardioides marmotae]MTB83506.1 ParB/RepB/Spo0J family partition protein [Nocardioides marmotae]
MTAKPGARRGLGRGLGSLIPTGPPPADPADSTTEDATQDSTDRAGAARAGDAGASGAGSAAPSVDGEPLAPVAGAYFAEIPVGQVVPNRAQPRQVFDEDAMAELVHSIREVGLLQPVVVRRTGPEAYELVMGERRWRASREAGLERIPAIVRETDDTDLLRDALLENLHRSDLNPLEEAAAYAQLLEDFGCTHEELAQRIGRSRPQISNTLRLLKLSPAVQRRVAAGVLSAGHARSLLAVDDAGLQDRLAQRVVAEGISVRGLEEIVAVGETGSAKRLARASRATTADVDDLVDRLADRLETRVKIDVGRTKGKITVEFASVEDLRRIADIMDPRNRNDRVI